MLRTRNDFFRYIFQFDTELLSLIKRLTCEMCETDKISNNTCGDKSLWRDNEQRQEQDNFVSNRIHDDPSHRGTIVFKHPPKGQNKHS